MTSTSRQQIQKNLQPINYQLHRVTRSAEAKGPRISLVSAKAAEQPSSTSCLTARNYLKDAMSPDDLMFGGVSRDVDNVDDR